MITGSEATNARIKTGVASATGEVFFTRAGQPPGFVVRSAHRAKSRIEMQRIRMALINRLRSPMAPVWVIVLCFSIGQGVVWSVLALYAVHLGAGMSVIGLLLATYGGTRIFLNLPAGAASQRWGRRRILLTGSALVLVGAVVGATALNLTWLFAAVILQGVGGAMYTTAALASAADLGNPQSRVSDMASYQGALLVGSSIGPALGGLVAEFAGFPATFVIQGAIMALALPALMRLPGRKGAPLRGSKTKAAAPGPGPRLLPVLFSLMSVHFAVFFARLGATWTLMPLIVVQKLGYGAGMVGLVIAAGALASLVALPFAGPAAAWFGRRRLVTVSSTGCLLGLAMLGLSLGGGDMGLVFAWLSSILLGLANGFTAPSVGAMVADTVPTDQLGAAMGLIRTVTDAAVVSAPLAIGLTVAIPGIGFPGGIAIAGAVYTGALGIFVTSSRMKSKRPDYL